MIVISYYLFSISNDITCREYNERNKSCDMIVREAEKELYEDNFLLFLMYKACRDLYCHTEVRTPLPNNAILLITTIFSTILLL